MKQFFALLALTVGFLQAARAQTFTQFRQGDSIVAGAGCSTGFSRYYAFKPRDASSYQHIAGNFGKDKFQAYGAGRRLPRIDPLKATVAFARQKDGKENFFQGDAPFLTDGQNVYYASTFMPGADAKDLVFVFDGRIPLFASHGQVYFEGHLLTGFNRAAASLIDDESHGRTVFFTDGQHVYRNETLLADVDVKSFGRDGYTARKLVDGKYVTEEIADSRDKNSFYFKGRKATPYPDWKATPFFPDSLYDGSYLVTFTSQDEVQDEKATPPVDFYLTPQDFEQLTKNKILPRKQELRLDVLPSAKGIITDDDRSTAREMPVKTYQIQVFKDQEVVSVLYYEEELEELDIKGFTRIGVAGDGFHLAKKDFDRLRQRGKPVRYRHEDIETAAAARQKIVALGKSSAVITYDRYSYCNCNRNKQDKDYQMQVYAYQLEDNQGHPTRSANFEGLFTLRVNRKKAATLIGGDLMTYINQEESAKKNELVTKLLGKGIFYADQDGVSEYIDGEEWLTFDVYCTKEFAGRVAAQFIQNEWHPIKHIVSWQER